MKRFIFVLSLIGLLLILTLEDKKREINFPHLPVLVGGKKLLLEVARTPAEMKIGLSGRDEIKSDGMLFIFEKSDYLSFWMKDTRIPLLILFFDENKLLVDHQEMMVEDERLADGELRDYTSAKKAKYALEVPLTSHLRDKVKSGEILSLKF